MSESGFGRPPEASVTLRSTVVSMWDDAGKQASAAASRHALKGPLKERGGKFTSIITSAARAC